MSVCVDVCQVELLKLRKANAALEEQNNSLMDRYARAERQIKEAADQAKGTHGERQAFETELAMAKAKAAELDAQLRELTCDGTVDKETLLRALRIVKRNPADDSAISASVVGKDVSQLRAENAELAHECEKLRQLLLVQESINSEQEKVAQGASQGIELVRSDLDKQINELHGKVQSRDARIAALQQQLKSSQMHHVRANTQSQMSLRRNSRTDQDASEGRNVVEFNLLNIQLEKEVMRDANPTTFVMFDFFVHDTQTTELLTGLRGEINCKREFVVKVDDFFLQYLHDEHMELEVFQTLGVDFKLLGTVSLPLRKLFDQSRGIVEGTGYIIAPNSDATSIGTLDYTIHMHQPVQDQVQLFRKIQQSKAGLKAVSDVPPRIEVHGRVWATNEPHSIPL